MFCSKCGTENLKGSKFCGNCGEIIEVILINRTDEQMKIQQENLKIQKQSFKIQQQQLINEKKNYESMAKCPRCGSISLSGNKKGFGIGKAVFGASTLGPLGLVMGNIGAKKVKVTCLKCGKNFKA